MSAATAGSATTATGQASESTYASANSSRPSTSRSLVAAAHRERRRAQLRDLGEATDADRAVRVLAPVNVYPPGGTGTSPPPQDYLAYLLSQTDHGAQFTDVTTTTVGGHPATILTATTKNSLDGSLGCQEEGMAAADCFGLQPDVVLRIAVVDAGDQTILIWLRNTVGVDEADQLEDFEQMLSTIRFR